MGITPAELRFLTAAYRSGALPRGGDILELGEAETIFVPDLAAALAGALHDIDRSEPALIAEARRLDAARSDYQKRFVGAKLVYKLFLGWDSILAVDGLPSPAAICIDLNRPCDLGRRFDVCINNGTSEHIFDQANVYRFMHDHTKAGGVMIHYTPGLGWLNHGFYNVQPGFFFDLAAANRYEMLFTALSGFNELQQVHRPDDPAFSDPRFADSLICTVLRKTTDAEFTVPYQGFYSSHAEIGAFAAVNSGNLAALLPPGRNVALGRPTWQSSTCVLSFHDDPRVDSAGGNNGRITGHYGFTTDCEPAPWWQVDLLRLEKVRAIRVFNRLSGGCGPRAYSLEIWISPDGEAWQKAYSNEGRVFGGADGKPLVVEFSPPGEARFVRLQLTDQQYLHLDEVEVYAAEPGI